MLRKIIEIDEARCDGCGQCALACAEGAIVMKDGKAKVVSEVFCDGLGACIGECPRDALRIVEREAPAFDEEAVRKHLATTREEHSHDACGCPSAKPLTLRMASAHSSSHSECGCPSSQEKELAPGEPSTGDAQPSTLGQWPVQMRLVPPGGAFYEGKPLVILADCAAVAHPELHRDILAGNVVAMACPKFEDGGWLREKLTSILRDGKPSEVRVVHMEVPCCSALVKAFHDAREAVGSKVPVRRFVAGIEGWIEEA